MVEQRGLFIESLLSATNIHILPQLVQCILKESRATAFLLRFKNQAIAPTGEGY